MEVPRRQVHGEVDLHSGVEPVAQLAEALIEYPPGQRLDQLGFFRSRNKLVRKHEPTLWVLPAQQRLHPNRPATGERTRWLVVETQLLSAHRLTEPAHE